MSSCVQPARRKRASLFATIGPLFVGFAPLLMEERRHPGFLRGLAAHAAPRLTAVVIAIGLIAAVATLAGITWTLWAQLRRRA
jgi:hypothetical protein